MPFNEHDKFSGSDSTAPPQRSSITEESTVTDHRSRIGLALWRRDERRYC